MECRLRINSEPSEDAGFFARQAKQTRENDRPGARSLSLSALVLVLLCTSGCARVKEVNFTDLAGNDCRTTKIHPDVISAETFTACIKDGQAETIPTQHTDMSMFAGAAAVLAAVISVSTF